MLRRVTLSLCRSLLSLYDAEILRTPRLNTSRPVHTRALDDDALFHRALADFTRLKSRGDLVRFFMLFTQARRVLRDGIEGSFAELGVYKGLTAQLLLHCCEDRTLHLFDTFEGHPENAEAERDGPEYVRYVTGEPMADTSLEGVQSTLGAAPNVVFHQGYFPATAKPVEDERFALVHLDGDQYRTMADGLAFFYPRTSAGGVIFCHDYGIYEGVRLAVDEFLAEREEVAVELPDATGSVLLVRGKEGALSAP